MAFSIDQFQEVGSHGYAGNSKAGGQTYSFYSLTDTIATMLGSGYFDDIAHILNVRDVIQLSGSNGMKQVMVESNDRVSVGLNSLDIAGDLQELSGAGAVSATTSRTEITTTGADALTLANGFPGQIKYVTMVVDGGDGTLTPTTGAGYTTITFADAGDSVILQYTSAGWAVIGSGGLGGGPVVA